ncbi:MAG: ATP-grasp domain-containing protein, partial [Planctomycetota bacterium]
MKSAKTVFILGAGTCQVPVIERARADGHRVLVASLPGPYPGLALADETLEVDVRDREAILEFARARQVDAVLTNQTDLPVPTAAYVAEQLGLPGIGLDAARRFTDKYVMRAAAARCGASPIAFHKTASADEAARLAADMSFPLVVKPVDNQGSRGVAKVGSLDDLPERFAAARDYAASGEVVIEEYFEGREVAVDGLLLNGRFQSFSLGDVSFFDIPGKFIPKSIRYPSRLPAELQDAVRRANAAIVKKLGLPFGLTHAEYRVREDTGELCLLEIAARGGGMFISSDIVPLCCGIEPEDILLRLHLGESVEMPDASFDRAAGFYCFAPPPGRLVAVSGLDEAGELPGVHRVVWDL